jgi:hypothetical protein
LEEVGCEVVECRRPWLEEEESVVKAQVTYQLLKKRSIMSLSLLSRC